VVSLLGIKLTYVTASLALGSLTLGKGKEIASMPKATVPPKVSRGSSLCGRVVNAAYGLCYRVLYDALLMCEPQAEWGDE